MLTTILTILHISISIILVLIVLVQQGKGADMGATFGGSSNTLFGAAGADNFLTKLTTCLAVAFMCTSVALAITGKSGGKAQGGRLFQGVASEAAAKSDAATEKSSETGASPAAAPVVNNAPPSEPAAAAPKASDTATETPAAQ